MNKIKIALLGAVVLFCSCSKGGGEDDPIAPEPTPVGGAAQLFERPSWSFSLQGSDPQPSWDNPNPHRYGGSMVGYVALPLSLASEVEPSDVLAAFYGEECRFVTHIDDAARIPVIIMGNENETGKVSFRYYSNKYHTTFIANDVLTFGMDKECGVLTPVFVPSQYPVVMTADLQITLIDATSGTEQTVSQSSSDMLAALIGGECRAVVSGDGGARYTLTIYGNAVGENIEIQYYSATTRHKYSNMLQLKQGRQESALQLYVISVQE